MKKPLLFLAVCLLLLILCFFLLCTDIGHDLILRLFPSANLGESMILWHARHEEEPPTGTQPLSEELPGTYLLNEITSPDLSLSSNELSSIRSLGIPLSLEVMEDGSTVLTVFDLKKEMICDTDSMLFRTGDEDLFFFYQDGILTMVDGEDRMVFEKASDTEP
jgi:hypothetical protein